MKFPTPPKRTYPPLPPEELLAKTRGAEKGCDVFTHLYCTCMVLREIRRLWTGYPRAEVIPTVADWLAALHDLGKVTAAFQDKIYRAIGPSPWPESPSGGNPNDVNHAKYSQILLEQYGRKFAAMAGAHHGVEFTLRVGDDKGNEALGGPDWEPLREELIRELKETLKLPECDLKKIPDEARDMIVGAVILADWISSGMDLPFGGALPDEAAIREAVVQAGFTPFRLTRRFEFTDVFPFEPNELQITAFSSIGPGAVAVIESGMGSGKTEAALFTALKILEDKGANGIYFAMPTCLTSRKIFDRMNDTFLKKILPGQEAILIHGNSWLEWKLKEQPDDGMPGTSGPDSWFQSKKRALLAPFGAGTIDQALLSVVNRKHRTLRSFALAGKVVILDEVHSYDAYTSTLIKSLIRALRDHGATVLILSATLTKHALRDLLDLQDGEAKSLAYPLVTVRSGADVREYPVPAQDSRRVKIRPASDDREVMGEALDRAMNGEQVLWIENTVSAAQERYKAFSPFAGGIELGLIHSRFPAFQREETEQKWVELLGKNGAEERVKRGRILVATQVLEQSVDVDADFLVTMLAPADMVFQRIGRLWRHPSLDSVRPKTAECQAVILCPEDFNDPEKLVRNPVVLPYDAYCMLRSFEIWKDRTSVELPADIRPILEKVYEDRAETGAPAALKREQLKMKEKYETLANCAQGSLGVGSDDSVSALAPPDAADEYGTRYSETEEVQVLLLRKGNGGFKLKDKACTIFGRDIDIPPASASVQEKTRAAVALNQVMVRVRECCAPPYSSFPSDGLGSVIWTGDQYDHPVRVAYVGDNGDLLSCDCNPIAGSPNIRQYNINLGYIAEKEKA